MKEIYYIEDLEQLRVFSDPFRVRIFWTMEESAKTGKMLADQLQFSPSKICYHLAELERVGLVGIEKANLDKKGFAQIPYTLFLTEQEQDKLMEKITDIYSFLQARQLEQNKGNEQNIHMNITYLPLGEK